MSNGSGDGSGNDKDTTVAKTAGFVVFSGIALSILKALNPYNNNHSKSTPPFQESKSPPLQEPTTKVITDEKTHKPTKIHEQQESSKPSKIHEQQESNKPLKIHEQQESNKPLKIHEQQESNKPLKIHEQQESNKPLKIHEQQESSPRAVEIVKGDTLWGLSRKYGVSIDAIKEANGLAGDTIYAGKKLVIP